MRAKSTRTSTHIYLIVIQLQIGACERPAAEENHFELQKVKFTMLQTGWYVCLCLANGYRTTGREAANSIMHGHGLGHTRRTYMMCLVRVASRLSRRPSRPNSINTLLCSTFNLQ